MFVYYLNVPLNETGVQELESYDDELANVKTFELSDMEYESLRKKDGLFERFDSELGTIIDVCEEEVIKTEQIPHAIDILENHLESVKDKTERESCIKIMEALKMARDADTFLEIDIYLE
ncbi:MAG: hypothetical protein K6F84_00550 [Lachnospiraceae bacterium]|nr:hypothetical protein [Lachnospiraceae bacterium]